MDDLKSKNPDIDTEAIKVDVPTVNPPNPPHQAQHPPAFGHVALPALRPQAYAPAPGNPGHRPGFQYQPAPAFGPGPGQNPMGFHPPQIGVPWQFPQYVANPVMGNPQMNVQRQPIPAPPAPVAPARQPRGTGNRQARNQPKRPAGRVRRR